MKLSDFDFDLPEALIATRPARPRSSARLLLAEGDTIVDRHVRDLPDILLPGDRLVLNDTKVIPARLTGERLRLSEQGPVSAKIEITLLEPHDDGTWEALAKPLRKLRPGETVSFPGGLAATVDRMEPELRLRFNMEGAAFEAALDRTGQMPLPPYIAGRRAVDARDRTDYQTVWAKNTGAVAAPTASLHFDEPLLDRLRQRGVDMTFVTLHVGAGTFLPVTVDDIADHKMHEEVGQITREAAAEINATRAAGGRIIPVGTTAMRLIETAADDDGTLPAWSGATDIFITPGYRLKITDALMTNFHLPKSTLMMLVSAVMGPERIREIYAHAIAREYRFFSYGDASLLIPSLRG
ncbi:tRNA preQ1(34) S-adenosylmethionine ribosyltransferase-isomerase QueA [Rhodobacterales bacterium HKCCE3408]|nr:tRNA preQ1(34) S-adenosylmethionine ribosyltransferase-isomerase QueA [Rhodobacterales bacterium HKCCE3408]